MNYRRLRLTNYFWMVVALVTSLSSLWAYLYIQNFLEFDNLNTEAELYPVPDTPLENFWWVFNGFLTDTSAAQIEHLIDAEDNFRWLSINSQGGSLTAANRIIEVLLQKEIFVKAVPYGACYSACVKVLLETDTMKRAMFTTGEFLIGIHRARLGTGLFARYVLEPFSDIDFDPSQMRAWIYDYSTSVGKFLDNCPESPFERVEALYLTNKQFGEIMHDTNDYSCKDIWHQDADWEDKLITQWKRDLASE